MKELMSIDCILKPLPKIILSNIITSKIRESEWTTYI